MKFAVVQGISPETEADLEYNEKLVRDLKALGHEAILCVAQDDRTKGVAVERISGIGQQKKKTNLLHVLAPLKDEWMRRCWFEKLDERVKALAIDVVVFPKATHRDLSSLRRHAFRRSPAALVFIMRDLLPKDCKKLGKQAYALLLRPNVRIGIPRSDQFGFETEIPNVKLYDQYKTAENIILLAED